MKNPLVSVIIACRNNREHIEESLQSIKNQTYKNIELIIVDNFSTDGTFEIAKKYANQVYQIGPERSVQFNYGFKKSMGKYIYRVGAEFILDLDLVEKCVDKMMGGYDALALHNRSVGDSIWAKVRYVERESYRNDNLVVAVRFMKRSVFEWVGMFDEALVAGEDFDLHNRIVAAGYRWGHVDAVEKHIGEPKSILDVWRKFYYYGRTLGDYVKKHKEIARRQFVVFRPSFKKIQRQLVMSPRLFVAFYFYIFVKFLAGACGMIHGGGLRRVGVIRTTVGDILTVEPLVSVVIPTYYSVSVLKKCLLLIRKQTYKNIELIIVDNNSNDGTRELAGLYGAKFFVAGPNQTRGRIFGAPFQRNFGFKRSGGEYLYYVDADMELPKDLIRECVNVMWNNKDCNAIIIPEESFGVGYWARCKWLEKRTYWGNDLVEAPRFFNRKVLQGFGYLDDSVGADDWDLSLRMREANSVILRTINFIMHNEGELTLGRLMRKRFLYGKDVYKFKDKHGYKKFIIYFNPFRISYIRHLGLLIRHPILLIGMVFMRFCEYVGGGLGMLYGWIGSIINE